MGGRTPRPPRLAARRGPRLARLILDTTVLVTADRKQTPLGRVVEDEDDVAVAAVTVAELLVGVMLADQRQRRRRQRFVNELLSVLHIEDYGSDVARVHAALLVHTRRSGRPRGAHDLIIAATAIAVDRELVSDDAGGFADLPGLRMRV